MVSCAGAMDGRSVKYTTRYVGRYMAYAKNSVTLYIAPARSVVSSTMGRSVTMSALGAWLGSAWTVESGRRRRKGMYVARVSMTSVRRRALVGTS